MYEISFIINNEDSSAVKKTLSKRGAEVMSESEINKIRLSFPIKKQSYGFLGSMSFQAEPELLVLISADLKLEENVLRFMISKAKEGRATKETRVADAKTRETRKETSKDETKKVTEPVLTNEELEKKIEEILK